MLKKMRQSIPWMPTGILIFAPAILLAPLWLTGKALFWGTPAMQFVPWWAYAWDTLLAGHLPLWNPYLGMGAPLAANLQSALFYPPNWLYFGFYLVGGITWMAWSQTLVVGQHLIGAGLGMARLVKKLGGSPLAQTVGGLAFSLSGYLVARAWFASVNAAVAWLPWILAAAFDLAHNAKPRRVFIQLSLLLGLQLLAGHAQTAWYTWLLTAFWLVYWGWQSNLRSGWLRLKIILNLQVRFGLAVLSAILLAAVQLMPTAEYLLQSSRASAAEYEAAMVYSFWPWRLTGLLAPNFFGNPARGDYWGYGNFWEDALYLGTLSFLLVAGSLFKALLKPAEQQPYKNLTRFLLGISILSLILALGQNTPIFPWLYRHVPTFDMFRAPTRFTIWLVAAFALLAGLGVDGWRIPVGRRLYWTRLGTMGAVAMMIGAGLGWYFLREVVVDFKPTFVPALALTGLFCAGTGVLALTMPEQDAIARRKRWAWAVVGWLAVDLLVAGWGLNPGIAASFYADWPASTANLQADLGTGRLYIPPGDEDRLKYQHYFIFETFDPGQDWNNLRASVLPNLNLLAKISSVNNYDPLLPARYARWMDEIRNLYIFLRPDLLDLMNISLLGWESAQAESGVRFAAVGERAYARWVPCARPAGTADEALQMALSNEIDFNAEVILESSQVGRDQTCQPAPAQLDWAASGPNRLSIRLQAPAPGWVVVSELWYPGWQARVNGQPVALERANYLFRAVAVPAGVSQIELDYRPLTFYSGLAISLIAWGAILSGFLKLKK